MFHVKINDVDNVNYDILILCLYKLNKSYNACIFIKITKNQGLQLESDFTR